VVRVLALSALYPPHHFGGYELACQDVLNRWQARGHDVRVLTSDFSLPDVSAPPNEPVDRALRLYWRNHELWSPHPFTRMRLERHNQRVLAATLDDFRPDVVTVWHMAGMSFGLLTTLVERKIPIVCVLQDDWLDFGPRFDAWARIFLDRPRAARAARLVTRVPTALADLGSAATFCFVSDTTRQHAETHSTWSFPVSSVVWSGVDRSTFYPSGRPERPWDWRLLFVGRIARSKGVDTVIRALPALPPAARLTIAGRGDPRVSDELHALAASLGVADRVAWTDVDREQLRALYTDADVVIFPARWKEPFGLVPVEAMACGTPVVATGTGGSGEICLDGLNCLQFPPDDVDALVERLQRLAGDNDLRQRLVRGGLATAEELTIDRLADILEDWHLATINRFADGMPAHRQLSLVSS
jgi:glycosyltransferase involved in cell wall biosynthesis